MKKPNSLPKTPKGLNPQSAALWRKLVSEFRFDDAALSILEQSMRALTRADRCAESIAQDGERVLDRYGVPKAHPLLAAEVQNRSLHARMLRELGLNLEEIKTVGRPPGR